MLHFAFIVGVQLMHVEENGDDYEETTTGCVCDFNKMRRKDLAVVCCDDGGCCGV